MNNPLQDNGLPKYSWFDRICNAVLTAAEDGKVKTREVCRVRKVIRREIVRTAKAFVGNHSWHNQGNDSQVRFLSKQIRLLSRQLALKQAENKALCERVAELEERKEQ